jgi:hypothetical protein
MDHAALFLIIAQHLQRYQEIFIISKPIPHST